VLWREGFKELQISLEKHRTYSTGRMVARSREKDVFTSYDYYRWEIKAN